MKVFSVILFSLIFVDSTAQTANWSHEIGIGLNKCQLYQPEGSGHFGYNANQNSNSSFLLLLHATRRINENLSFVFGGEVNRYRVGLDQKVYLAQSVSTSQEDFRHLLKINEGILSYGLTYFSDSILNGKLRPYAKVLHVQRMHIHSTFEIYDPNEPFAIFDSGNARIGFYKGYKFQNIELALGSNIIKNNTVYFVELSGKYSSRFYQYNGKKDDWKLWQTETAFRIAWAFSLRIGVLI